MERSSGKYFAAGTALRQISLATGGTLTLKRSGKSRRTRYVDPRSVYFLAQIAPKRGIWHQKSQKKFQGVTSQCEGATPFRTHSQYGYTPCAGAQAPSLLGPTVGLGNRFPKSKFTTGTTPLFLSIQLRRLESCRYSVPISLWLDENNQRLISKFSV